MTEILFYHLTERPLEHVLPDILEKSLQRGWKVAVKAPSLAKVDMLDSLLWTFREDSFLPHGKQGEANAGLQPVILTSSAFTNNPQVLILIDGARQPLESFAEYERVCIFFDGNDEARLAEAREDWRAISSTEHKAVYWAQDGGRWVKKAESN